MTSPHILITGANKGIGLALVAAVLEARDDAVVLLGSRSLSRGESAREGLIASEPAWAERVVVVQLDVGDDDSVRAAARAVAERCAPGALYGIVNNAGVGFGELTAREVLNVNARGPRRVCEAFASLLAADGRVVNVSSAAGPSFIAGCSPARKKALTDPEVTWDAVESQMAEFLAVHEAGGDLDAAGFADSVYGLSKACLNAYTMELARAWPKRTVNACTPGFIETDMTRGFATSRGVTPADVGMKPPKEGTRAPMHLLFGEPGGSGWYFGSDAVRSPIDRYRSPGDPPYTP